MWFVQHLDEVLAVFGAVVGIATIVVKWTPTQKDDNLLAKIIKVMVALSLCNEDGTFTKKDGK